MTEKCRHKMTYWEYQYGDGNNLYVVRQCKLCKMYQKAKIGAFRKCEKKEIYAWSRLKNSLTKKPLSLGSMRQWLNEERIDDPSKLITTEDLEYWVNPLIKEAVKAERKRIGEEIIKLSYNIEDENSTEFNEWRAFKRFRNELRDKYLNKE